MTNSDEINKLTPAQMLAVNLLAFGENITSVAEKIGISRQTVSYWQNKDGLFQEALWNRQYDLWNSELLRVRSMTSKALDVLYEALESENYKERLTAAKMLISTLGLPALIGQQLSPLSREYWRPLTEREKDEQRSLMQAVGMEVGDLSTAMVKMS